MVEEVGPHVSRVKPGDRVVACFFTYCGTCFYCRRGWFSQCEEKSVFGYGEHFGNLGGGQAEYCVAPNANHTLEPIPDGVSDEQALFVGDILATGYFGAERAGVEAGDSVAVIGCGPVGLMAIMSARLLGAARILAVDMVQSRLEMAERLGAIPIDGSARTPRRRSRPRPAAAAPTGRSRRWGCRRPSRPPSTRSAGAGRSPSSECPTRCRETSPT